MKQGIFKFGVLLACIWSSCSEENIPKNVDPMVEVVNTDTLILSCDSAKSPATLGPPIEHQAHERLTLQKQLHPRRAAHLPRRHRLRAVRAFTRRRQGREARGRRVRVQDQGPRGADRRPEGQDRRGVSELPGRVCL